MFSHFLPFIKRKRNTDRYRCPERVSEFNGMVCFVIPVMDTPSTDNQTYDLLHTLRPEVNGYIIYDSEQWVSDRCHQFDDGCISPPGTRFCQAGWSILHLWISNCWKIMYDMHVRPSLSAFQSSVFLFV